jgi:hypothetical protein
MGQCSQPGCNSGDISSSLCPLRYLSGARFFTPEAVGDGCTGKGPPLVRLESVTNEYPTGGKTSKAVNSVSMDIAKAVTGGRFG